ncbi:MAG: hypothetical protein H6714_06715 [Myxococcales bacterium]|nr:hypothetical protein [Myxococcales bacterium]
MPTWIARFADRHRWLIFGGSLAALCAVYIGIEALYVNRVPLIADEFHGFAHILKLTRETPYRDFVPYKTILGYYFQLIPALFSDSPWWRLLYIKWSTALLTASLLATTAILLRRIYHLRAIVGGLALLMACSTFLERSADLRLDMLTSLCGLLSFVFLLRAQVVWCGLLAGLSFLISQKGVYYIVAGSLAWNVGLFYRFRNRKTWSSSIVYHACVLAVIGTYFAVCSAIASFDAVSQSVFSSGAKNIALQELYAFDWIRVFWVRSWSRNPLFYLLSVLSLGRLFALRDAQHGDFKNLRLLAYGVTMLVVCMWHKQPWPYFLVILLPTLSLLIVDLLSAEIDARGRLSLPLMAAIVVFGVVLPLQRVPVVLARDNNYQRYNVELASALLDKGDTYFAGVAMIASHEQQPPELAWLDHPRGTTIKGWPRDRQRALIERMEAHPPKLLIRNNRFKRLPKLLKKYLADHYKHFYGSVFTYRVLLQEGATDFNIPFKGHYRVSRSKDAPHGEWNNGKKIFFTKGKHTVLPQTSRIWLEFIPEGVDHLLWRKYRASQELFPPDP